MGDGAGLQQLLKPRAADIGKRGGQEPVQPPAGLRVEFSTSTIAAVPEPETYAMLIAGLGLVGFAARRRKQA